MKPSESFTKITLTVKGAISVPDAREVLIDSLVCKNNNAEWKKVIRSLQARATTIYECIKLSLL